MTEIEIRPASGDDWQLWRAIRLRALQDCPTAFGSTYEREVGFAESDWRARLGQGGPAVLATARDGPVGIGSGFQDLEGWLHVVAMWVDPAWRGHGIGRRVLAHLVAWAHEHRLRTHLDVTLGNGDARLLYERFGFVGTGETRPLREGSPDLVERMVLPD